MTTQKANRQDLYALFDKLSIKYETHNHRPVFTVEEGQDIKAKIKGAHTKNLFLKDKDGAFYLICALGETQIKLNQVHKSIGAARLSFGNEEAMWEILGVRPGSVTLFALINDTNQRIGLIIDKALFDFDIVNFHPLSNDATTSIKADAMQVFIENWGGKVQIADFAAMTSITD